MLQLSEPGEIGGIVRIGKANSGPVVLRDDRAKVPESRGDLLEYGVRPGGGDVLVEPRDAERRLSPDLAAIGGDLAREHAQEAALARPVAADERDPFSSVDLEIRLLEEGKVAVGKTDVLKREQRHRDLEQTPGEDRPEGMGEPPPIVPRNLAAPELPRHRFTRCRQIADGKRPLVLLAVTAQGLRGREGGVDEDHVDGTADECRHLTHRIAGGEMLHAAPLGEQVRHEHDRPFHLLNRFRRTAHQEDGHEARIEAARADDDRVELWNRRRGRRMQADWRLEPHARNLVACRLPRVHFQFPACRAAVPVLRAHAGRLHADRPDVPSAAEERAQKLVAIQFFLLAPYVATEAILQLVHADRPETSWLGIGLAASSVIGMPLLGLAKRRIGDQLGSSATKGEGMQNVLCAYLAGGVLLGLLGNALFELWWLDPAAALAIAAVAVREGLGAWRGEGCCVTSIVPDESCEKDCCA